MIVCYTNHALDQFLKGISKFCNKDGELIRVGGKSKCAELEKYNLSTIKSQKKTTKFTHSSRNDLQKQQYSLKVLRDDIFALEKHTKRILDTILGEELVSNIRKLNSYHYTQLNELANGRLKLNEAILDWLGYRQENIAIGGLNLRAEEQELDRENLIALEQGRFIDGESLNEGDHNVQPGHVEGADGFQQVEENREYSQERISKEIQKSQIMSEQQATAVADITGLSLDDRWNLYRLCVKLYALECESRINEKREQYRIEQIKLTELQQQEDIEIVKKAKIIGMTTTGAAKYRHIINGTNPTITSTLSFRSHEY